MPLNVFVIKAEIPKNANLYERAMLETSNSHAEQMAEEIRNSTITDLDPKDGRESNLTLKVNPKNYGIEHLIGFKPPKDYQ